MIPFHIERPEINYVVLPPYLWERVRAKWQDMVTGVDEHGQFLQDPKDPFIRYVRQQPVTTIIHEFIP